MAFKVFGSILELAVDRLVRLLQNAGARATGASMMAFHIFQEN
jgi:hypothetical protein